MKVDFRKLTVGVAIVAMLFAVSCSQDEEDLENFSPEQIYRLGEREMTNRRYSAAAEKFGEIERLHPYSDWARRGAIMAAYAYNLDQEYEQSRAAAERFLSFYPADEDAAYAQYLIALSYYDQLDTKGRDRVNAIEAWKALRKVVEEYGDSEYADLVDLQMDLAVDRLASKEMEVGRYYLKHKHYGPAIARFQSVVDNSFLEQILEESEEDEVAEVRYDKASNYVPEALHRLVEAYVSIGFTREAEETAAILGHNFASSEWYADSYALLQSSGAQVPGRRPIGNPLGQITRRTIRGEWL